jgi:hypothetical protein
MMMQQCKFVIRPVCLRRQLRFRRFTHSLAQSVNKQVAIRNVRVACRGFDYPVAVQIASHWEAFVDIDESSKIGNQASIDYYHLNDKLERIPDVDNDSINSVDVFINNDNSSKDLFLKVLVPEYVNVSIDGDITNVSLSNKVSSCLSFLLAAWLSDC